MIGLSVSNGPILLGSLRSELLISIASISGVWISTVSLTVVSSFGVLFSSVSFSAITFVTVSISLRSEFDETRDSSRVSIFSISAATASETKINFGSRVTILLRLSLSKALISSERLVRSSETELRRRLRSNFSISSNAHRGRLDFGCDLRK